MSGGTSAKKKLLNAEIKSLIGPCMISFAIPLLVPGFTITLVAFSDETGFTKYGALHVTGIIFLSVSILLLIMGCITRCACKVKVAPSEPILHRVTTHGKIDRIHLTAPPRERSPHHFREPIPGASAGSGESKRQHSEMVAKQHHVLAAKIDESDSSDDTSSLVSDPSKKQTNQGDNLLPLDHHVNSKIPSDYSGTVNTGDTKTLDSNLGAKVPTNWTHFPDLEHHSPSANDPLLLEGNRLLKVREVQPRENVPESLLKIRTNGDGTETTFMDIKSTDEVYRSDEVLHKHVADNLDQETPNAWVTDQPTENFLKAGLYMSTTSADYGSSVISDYVNSVGDVEDDDVTLTGVSRGCSTLPDIGDLEKDAEVVGDRFNSEWRSESQQHSVDISSVLSQGELSDVNSVSEISGEQIEFLDPGVESRHNYTRDSAFESACDHWSTPVYLDNEDDMYVENNNSAVNR